MTTSQTELSRNISQVFFEEMVKHIRPADQNSGFDGGSGEAQFRSFLDREYASILADSLDLKLVEGKFDGH